METTESIFLYNFSKQCDFDDSNRKWKTMSLKLKTIFFLSTYKDLLCIFTIVIKICKYGGQRQYILFMWFLLKYTNVLHITHADVVFYWKFIKYLLLWSLIFGIFSLWYVCILSKIIVSDFVFNVNRIFFPIPVNINICSKCRKNSVQIK